LLSEEVTDPVAKGTLLAMARAWARLADLAEKNLRNGLVREAPAQSHVARLDWRSHQSGGNLR